MPHRGKNRGGAKNPKPDDFFVLTPLGNRDRNETFAVKKSCQYLLRLISRRFVLDAELIDIICWIAGDSRDRIGVLLLSRLPEELRERYEEDLRYDPSGHRLFGETLLRILRKTGSRRLVEAFYNFAFYKPGRVSHAMLIDALEQEAAIKRIHQGETPIGF